MRDILPGGEGKVDAVVCWFSARLERSSHRDGGAYVSTAPGEGEPMRGYSWGQTAHFLPTHQPTIKVKPGERLCLRTSWAATGVSFTLIQRPKVSPHSFVGGVGNSAEVARTILLQRSFGSNQQGFSNWNQHKIDREERRQKALEYAAKAEERKEKQRLAYEAGLEKRRLKREEEVLALGSYEEQAAYFDKQRKRAGAYAVSAAAAGDEAYAKRHPGSRHDPSKYGSEKNKYGETVSRECRRRRRRDRDRISCRAGRRRQSRRRRSRIVASIWVICEELVLRCESLNIFSFYKTESSQLCSSFLSNRYHSPYSKRSSLSGAIWRAITSSTPFGSSRRFGASPPAGELII